MSGYKKKSGLKNLGHCTSLNVMNNIESQNYTHKYSLLKTSVGLLVNRARAHFYGSTELNDTKYATDNDTVISYASDSSTWIR